MVVVWMFITQVLAADHSCQQAVARLNAWRVAQGLRRVSSDTTSYCKARIKLPVELFGRLLNWTASKCEEVRSDAWLFHERVVEMVDGWTVTMADTAKNQRAYLQMSCHKPGCGFPIARMVGIFSLATVRSRTWPLVPTRANRQARPHCLEGFWIMFLQAQSYWQTATMQPTGYWPLVRCAG